MTVFSLRVKEIPYATREKKN